MRNLLKETTEILSENNKTIEDIVWFGTEENFIDGDICSLLDITYDNGYGGQEIASDLILRGEDFWLERHEYDGSEWWEYKEMPEKPKLSIKVNSVIGGCWDKLEEINK